MSIVSKLFGGMKGTVENGITLELDRGGVQARVTARQGDALVHCLRVRLTFRGRKYSPDAAVIAQLYGLRTDGETVSCDGRILTDGSVEIIPGGGFFGCGGTVLCRLVLRGSDGGELYSPAFAIDAEPAFGNGTAPVPAEEYSRLEELLLQVLDAKRICEDIAANMSEYGGVSLSDMLPLTNGTAFAGAADTAARADHVHPTDTSRMPSVETMSRGGVIDAEDKFPFMDTSEEVMKYARWSNMIAKLWESIESKVKSTPVDAAHSIYSNAGGQAYLPEDYTDGEGVIALVSDIPEVPVQSVNGKTGGVVLTASDVGAVPDTQTITVTGVDEDGVTHTWTMYGVES